MDQSVLASRSVRCVVLFFAAPLAAQGLKLSAPPGEEIVGDVTQSRFSPDGEWLVYQADQETDGVTDLYSVPAAGDQRPVRLDPPSIRGSGGWFAVSPDSRSVAFASVEGTGRPVLFCAPIDGSRPALALSSGRQYLDTSRSPQFCPDGTRIVYGAYTPGEYEHQLYIVPIDGGAAPRRLTEGSDVVSSNIEFQIDARGRRVVYAVTRDGANQLFSVPLAENVGHSRPVTVQLNAPLPAGASVDLFQLTPDGRAVVYIADQQTRGQKELFLVPIDGSAPPRKLNAPLPRAGLDVEYDFAISPDGARVVYRAPDSTSSRKLSLYSVPLDGSQPPVVLNAPLENDAWGYQRFMIDPTSEFVVYFADQVDGRHGRELFVARIDGSTPSRRLSAPLGDEGSINSFALDRAGQRAVYSAYHEDEDGHYVYELFSTALRGLAVIRLGDGLLQNVSRFEISPDSRRVVVFDYDYGGPTNELYSLAIDGRGDPIPLNGPAFLGLRSFSLAPRGGRALFVADCETLGAFELYCAPLDGGSAPAKRSGPLVSAPASPRSVHSFEFSSDGSQAVYFENGCDEECDGDHTPDALFQVASDASRAARRLYPPTVPGVVRLDDTYPFHLSPDGRRLVFCAGYPGCDGYGELMELYSAPLDGSQPPVRLNEPVEADNDVRGFAFTPDGAGVVFVAASELFRAPIEGGVPPTALARTPSIGSVSWFSLTRDGARAVFLAADELAAYELYSVPIDGSAPPVEIGEPLPPEWFVLDLAVSGERVAYRVGPYPWRATGPSEIHSAPLAGGASIRLGGPLVAGGDFTALQMSRDGSRVVYLADQEVDERFELYSVPADGSAGAVKLNGALIDGGDVAAQEYYEPRFALSADGRRVVYLADQEVDDRFELYSAPLDGSAAAVKLNGTFQDAMDVRSFQLDPAGQRVVFAADALTNRVFELFVVPIDGSAAPLRLDTGDVASPYGRWSFQITPDGETVLYLSNRRVVELFGVPLDGRSRPYRLSAPLVAGGNVASFQVSPDSSRVLYLADQEVDGLTELFVSFLIHDRPRSR